MDDPLGNTLQSLRCEPSSNKLHKFIKLPQPQGIVELLSFFLKRIRWGVDSPLFERCFFSSVISFYSTVRECNIEQHILAERIYLAFAY